MGYGASMIVFISCTKKKLAHSCSAKEMYTASQWFRGGWRFAESLHPDHIYILSAKYGLLRPDDIIEPYNKTLVTENIKAIKVWSAIVARQIYNEGIDRSDRVIFLCGLNYRRFIRNLFPNRVEPLAHMGIGKQMQYFKENT